MRNALKENIFLVHNQSINKLCDLLNLTVLLLSHHRQHANHSLCKTKTKYFSSFRTDKSKNATEAAQIIRNSQVVCFDVDSTVIREEGIDELAKFCGKGQEVARLTKEAMKGSMTFQEALRLRLNIIKPTQKQIRDFLKAHPSTLSTGIRYKPFIVWP